MSLSLTLLILGMSKLGTAQTTSSGSVGIEGTIPSTPPQTGATITFPVNGQTFTDLPIRVTGICSGDVLVKLFKNGVFAGSAQCDNGNYTIAIDLFNGTNELIAKVFDALDQQGPDSNKVTVTFNEKLSGSVISRVSITSNFAKRGAEPGQTLDWPFVISGGSSPYAVSIDWGDGKTDLISRAFGGSFDIHHIYESSGIYNIVLKVSDAKGATAFIQVVGVSNGPISQSSTQNSQNLKESASTIIWWPLLLAIIFVIISFWLGRRHQMDVLRRRIEQNQQ